MVHFAVAWLFAGILVAGLKVASLTTDGGSQLILTNAATGTAALLIYVPVVLLVSHVTFTWIEDPIRRKTKSMVAMRRAPSAGTVPAADDGRGTIALMPAPTLDA